MRAALAGVVMELAPVLGKQSTIDQLVPVFLTLLKDVYPDVRLNVISKLDQVNQVCVFVTVLCKAVAYVYSGMGCSSHYRTVGVKSRQ